MEAPGESRRADVKKRIAEIRAAIEAAKAEAVGLRDLQRDPHGPPPPRDPAITLADMEEVLTTAPATRDRLRANAAISGTYWLDLPAHTLLVTFDRKVLEENAPEIRLLTYGTDELQGLLAVAGVVPPELPNGAFQLPGDGSIRDYAELARPPGPTP